MSLKKEIMWRVAIIYFGMLVFGFAIFAKIIYLQFFDAKEWLTKQKEISVKEINIEPYRGDILDCKGHILATSVPYYEIRLDLSYENIPADLYKKSIDSLSLRLSRLFNDMSPAGYKHVLNEARRAGKRYFMLKKNVSYPQLKEAKTFPLFRLGKNKGGFIPVQQYIRKQPYITLASRTVGYLTQGETGNIVGIEGAFDADLKGTTGLKVMHKIAGGYWMPINDDNEVEPQDGYDIVTTIDVELQDVAESALRYQLLKSGADHGSVVLMEVATGEIKAIANLGLNGETGNYEEVYNYAIGESTEPGSTFKLPVLMTAMEDGYIKQDDTIDTEKGSVKFYDKVIRDHEEKGYGKIPVNRVFELSSNVGCAKIVDKCYHGRERKFIDRLYSFNLNQKLGLDIRGEGEPQIKYPGDKLWSGISALMMSHGYELKLAPIHILAFYNAVANNGKMVKPRFVKEVRQHGMIMKKFDTEIINPSICSYSTIHTAKKMLEGVVEHGTAVNLKGTHLKIAGKTGTAQIANKNKGYGKETKMTYQASFCGYFPAEDPKYSCIVVINAPSNDVYYGNVVAGPVFKEIAEKVYSSEMGAVAVRGSGSLKNDAPYSKNGLKAHLVNAFDELGIDYEFNTNGKKADWLSAHQDSAAVKLSPKKIIKNLVPDVTGMGVQDALYLLENEGLRVVFHGYGAVQHQSIAPGNVAENGALIYLDLTN